MPIPKAITEAMPYSVGMLTSIVAVAGLSHMGRPGLVEGTRELLEAPYIMVYSVDEPADESEVISIVHGARDRKGLMPDAETAWSAGSAKPSFWPKNA